MKYEQGIKPTLLQKALPGENWSNAQYRNIIYYLGTPLEDSATFGLGA